MNFVLYTLNEAKFASLYSQRTIMLFISCWCEKMCDCNNSVPVHISRMGVADSIN